MPDKSDSLDIAGKVVGKGHPALLVAEVAQAHEGSIALAQSYIDAAADAGADAIKFQMHIAEEESTLDEPFRVAMQGQDKNRYAYWKRMEFNVEQWRGLKSRAEEKGLIFLCTPFSVKAIEQLKTMGIKAWKIGSGDMQTPDIIDAVIKSGLPTIISTGMSDYASIDETINKFKNARLPHALMQCTSSYPTALENVGLNILDEMAERYQCPVGLSDHSGSPWPGLLAIARGIDILEVHVTLDRRIKGPDTTSSLTFEELARISEARDAWHIMDKHPVDKDLVAKSFTDLRSLFGRSIALREDCVKGTILTSQHLTLKKPGYGIPADQSEQLIGMQLKQDVSANRLLSRDDLKFQQASLAQAK